MRGTRRSATGFMLTGGFTALMAACTPNGCQTAEPPGDLVFTVPAPNGVGTQVVAAKNTLATNNAWGPPALGQALATTSLDPQNPFVNMSISYQTNPAPAGIYRDEIDVYARDPHEYLTTLEGYLNNADDWRTQTSGCYLPDTLKLLYPTLVGAPATWGPPTLSNTFFPDCDPGSIAPSLSAPIGYGSVHAAWVNDRGLCAAEVPYDQILPQLQQALFSSYAQNVGQSGCADAEQVFFFASPYVNENPTLDPDLAPTGGFLINFYFDTHVKVPFISDLNAYFNYEYQWGLSDGILSVTASKNGEDVHGGGGPADPGQAQSGFEAALEGQLPRGISDTANQDQAVDLFAPDSANPAPDCVPNAPGDPYVYLPSADQGGQCSGAINFTMPFALGKAASDGTLASLGINPTVATGNGQLPVDALVTREKEVDPSTPANTPPRYHNWRCLYGINKNYPDSYRCAYVVRAKRINTYPDSVQLVWTDNPALEMASDSFTSALIPYILAKDSGSDTALGSLCNGASGRYTRTFTVLDAGDQYNSSSGFFSCTGDILGGLLSNPWGQTGAEAAIFGTVVLIAL